MSLSPAKIIEESRRLEGCSVDLGVDEGTHEFQLQRLAQIKSMIDQSESGTLEHAKLVDRYNTLLYIILDRLEHDQELLPASVRLNDDLTLLGYLDYERYVQRDGFYTLARAWDQFELIGVIDILPIAFPRRLFLSNRVSYRLVESYKGDISQAGLLEREQFGWVSYLTGSRYFVLWSEGFPGRGPRWRFDSKTDSAIVNTEMGKRFWPFETVTATEWTTNVRWRDLHDWARQQSRKTNSC